MVAVASLLPLQRADGSASYTSNGFSVLAAINGPVEVQRRDELAEEAAIDVVVRPAAGVGGVRERQLESLIHRTLRHVICVSAHPRKLIQVTLQVTATPWNSSVSTRLPQAMTNLPILPALLQASLLALLSTSIPLTDIYTSILMVVDLNRSISNKPSPKDIDAAQSLHLLVFSAHDRILLAESEGSFDIYIWETVLAQARQVCRSGADEKSMNAIEGDSSENCLRSLLGAKIVADQHWKKGLK